MNREVCGICWCPYDDNGACGCEPQTGATMNRDDIIRMAREAHHELITQDYPGHAGQLDPWTMRLLERFFHAAYAAGAAAEREECAKLAEATICDTHLPTGVRIYGTRVASAIRARSNT